MRDDDVGYRRPPLSGRFKPGVSGNPQGRPKRQRSAMAEIIQDVLTAPISYREKGRVRTATRQVLVFKAIVDRALGGDLKAAEDLLRQMQRAYRAGHAGNERIEIVDWLPDDRGQPGEQTSEARSNRGADQQGSGVGTGDESSAAPAPGTRPLNPQE
jgi:hypothetical protein